MYTRAAFDQQRSALKQLSNREGRVLALVSIGGGVGQLVLIRLLERGVPRPTAVAIEGAIFLAYLALIGWLLWRRSRRLRLFRLTCPHCGAVLEGMSARVAAATGRCDGCGGQVVE